MTEARIIAKKPIIEEKFISSGPAAIIAPTIITLDIAFVTAVTNAISSVIIVGAIIAAGPEEINFSSIMGFLAIILASVNIFGGFVVSHRMLSMFKKKEKKKNK